MASASFAIIFSANPLALGSFVRHEKHLIDYNWSRCLPTRSYADEASVLVDRTVTHRGFIRTERSL